MVGDQPVAEAELGATVVDDVAPGCGERIAGDPVGSAGGLVGVVLDQVDADLLGAGGEHPPHPAHLLAVQGSSNTASGV
jgi:hypothetical protein